MDTQGPERLEKRSETGSAFFCYCSIDTQYKQGPCIVIILKNICPNLSSIYDAELMKWNLGQLDFQSCFIEVIRQLCYIMS